MIKHLFILFAILLNFNALAQTYSDGYRAGYKEGYCHNKYGCVAPPVVPETPKLGKDTFNDGYNDGFAKGKVDNVENVDNKSDSESKLKRNDYKPPVNQNVNIGEIIQQANNQSQQNLKTKLEIELKRAELEKQQIELLNLEEEREKQHEAKANNKPEIDFESGNIENYKIKIPNKYSLQVFNPSRWNEMAIIKNESVLIGKRIYDDGTILLFGISGSNCEKGSGLENINAIYDTISSYPKIKIGLGGKNNIEGFLVDNIVFGESAFLAGIKIGDVITKIENENINENTIISNLYKNKLVGDTLHIEFKRNGEKYYTEAILRNREGEYNGRLKIGGYPAIFSSWVEEEEDYGVKKKILYIKNIVAVNNDLLTISYIITPDSEYVNFDKEFLRFKNTVKTHLNFIKIE